MGNFKIGDVVKPTEEMMQEDKLLCHLVSGKVSHVFEETPEYISLSDCTWDNPSYKSIFTEPLSVREEWFTLVNRKEYDEELHFMFLKKAFGVRFIHKVNGKVVENCNVPNDSTSQDGLYSTCVGIINRLKENSHAKEEEGDSCALPDNTIRVGDIVRVVDDGAAYSTYSSWFKENACEHLQYRYAMGIRFFCRRYGFDKSTKFRVVAVPNNPHKDGMPVYAIETVDYGFASASKPLFLIGEMGVVLDDSN